MKVNTNKLFESVYTTNVNKSLLNEAKLSENFKDWVLMFSRKNKDKKIIAQFTFLPENYEIKDFADTETVELYNPNNGQKLSPCNQIINKVREVVTNHFEDKLNSTTTDRLESDDNVTDKPSYDDSKFTGPENSVFEFVLFGAEGNTVKCKLMRTYKTSKNKLKGFRRAYFDELGGYNDEIISYRDLPDYDINSPYRGEHNVMSDRDNYIPLDRNSTFTEEEKGLFNITFKTEEPDTNIEGDKE